METIKLEEAQAGMVLAAPLTGAGGVVMLPQGTRLTVVMLQRLARVAVAEITIAGDNDAAATRPTAPTILPRFRADDGSGVLAEIQRVATKHGEARRREPGLEA